MMKKQLLLLALSLLPLVASAYDLAVDNEDGVTIYYNVISDYCVEVTDNGSDNSYSGDVKIPQIVGSRNVTSIGDMAFDGCSSLTSIEIPSSVTNIGSAAFRGCSGLTSIEIPNSVTSIEDDAFDGCSGLTSIEIPSSVTNIGEYPLRLCSGLTSITVESGNTNYDSRDDCNAIIETSSNRLIAGCKNTVIPNSVTSIAWNAFDGCSSLTSIEIPNSVTSIGEMAFQACWELTSVNIPSSVTTIGQYAFWLCWALTSIEIPSSVTSIGESAFNGCSSLNSITVESGNTVYDSRNNCNAIIETSSNTLITGCKNTVIPNSVTSIGDQAFQHCDLTSITIPNNVTRIGDYAFFHTGLTGLTSIEIPSGVTSIGDYAFSSYSLTAVKVDWETPISITSDVFSNRANATLHVPAGSKAAYEAADYWNEFKEIVEYATITMGSSGIATYSSNVDLDFTNVEGLKAYIACGFSPSTGDLTMVRVNKVPAGEGLLLKGEPGSYDIPSAPVDYVYANLLVGVPTATTVDPTDGEYTNFILSKDELNVIGFYPLSQSGTIASGKAYLHIPSAAFATARKVNMVFEDEEEEEVTGINALNEKGARSNEKFFDLQGRRVANPTRGLYIKGGKKIMVK